MAKAADFDGKANETEVVTSESVKGKRKTSILGTKARLWLITINNPQNHGISLEQAEILERFKEDIASGAVTYVSSVMERSLTTDENGKHIDDVGTDYVLNPTSGDWEQRYLLPPHIEPKKENDHDESEQQ